MKSTTSPLALCAALLLGMSACKAGDDAAEKEKESAGAVAAGEEKAGEEKAGEEKAGEEKPGAVAAGEDKAGEEKPAEDKPAEDKGADPAGKYTSDAVTLTISNVTKTGFDYEVSSPSADGEDDPCGGISYKGAGTFDGSDPTKATTDNEETLSFSAGSVNFEPSMEMIGNDCARQIDTKFDRAAS